MFCLLKFINQENTTSKYATKRYKLTVCGEIIVGPCFFVELPCKLGDQQPTTEVEPILFDLLFF